MTDARRSHSFLLKIPALVLLSVAIGFLAAKRVGLGVVPGSVIGLAIFCVGTLAVVRLENVPREMWFTFCLKLFSVTAYKLLNVTLVLWLATDHGFSNADALKLITAWGIFMSIATVLSGSITDALGLRRTLLLGVSLCVLCRLVMVATTNTWLAISCGLLPLAVGEALCTPVLVVAVRRYSSASQRSIAFSLFYAVMNLGFMLAYFINDGVREAIKQTGQITLPLINTEVSDFRTLLLVSMGIELLMLPFILLLRRGAAVSEEGVLGITPEVSKYPSAGLLEAFRLTVRDAARDTVRLFADLMKQPGFYQLLVFLLLIGLLKIVFNIMDYVLPPFAKLEVGPEMEARVGRFNAINSILILLLAPIVAIMTRRFSAYSMVILGGFITACSFVFIILPPATFQGMANGRLGDWIGHGYMGLTGAVHPYYVMIILWQVGFSLGEAFYSPRVYEYAASIAPKGKEASYASLSYIPMLIGKTVTGGAFAWLLARSCPETGPRNPGMMWLIIALLILIAPVGLLLLQRFIRVKEVGRDG